MTQQALDGSGGGAAQMRLCAAGEAKGQTTNLPASATVSDVAQAFQLAWKLGCKGITVYRDGSRQDQVLNIGTGSNGTPPDRQPDRPIRLGAVIPAQRIRVDTPDGGVYVHIGYAEGRPVEVFASTPEEAKNEEIYEAFARIFSIALQWGVPLEKLLKQLEGANRKYGSVSTVPAAILRAFRLIQDRPNQTCPKCGGTVRFQEGCQECTACGWSRCE